MEIFSFFPFSALIILTQQGEEMVVVLGGFCLWKKKKVFNVTAGGLNETDSPPAPQVTESVIHALGLVTFLWSSSISFPVITLIYFYLFSCHGITIVPGLVIFFFCVRSQICGFPHCHLLPRLVSSEAFVVASIWSLS